MLTVHRSIKSTLRKKISKWDLKHFAGGKFSRLHTCVESCRRKKDGIQEARKVSEHVQIDKKAMQGSARAVGQIPTCHEQTK